jgi:Flp pilus assembly protein TadG
MNKKRFAGFKGQDLVEFAIILPIFALFIVGITDLGRAVYYFSTMSNAAREGARYGSIHVNEIIADDSNVCNQVVNWSIAVVLTCDDVDTVVDLINKTVTVTVSYNFDPITPLIADYFPSQMLNARSTMTLEYVPQIE